MSSRTYIGCLADAVKHGRISRRVANRLQQELDGLGIDSDAAAIPYLQGRSHDATKAQMNAAIQASINTVNKGNQLSHPHGAITGGNSHLVRDVTDKAKHANVEKQYRALIGRWHSINAKALAKMRTKSLGWSYDQELGRQIVLELRGVNTSNADALEMAAALAETFEEAREMFNAAGGNIKARQDYFSPQFHDRRRISAVEMDEYVNDVKEWLDVTGMFWSDGTGVAAADVPGILRHTYNHYVTDGARTAYGPKAVKNRHADHRFLKFTPEGFIKYQEKYGIEDMFGGMRSHLDTMAREIAAMQVLGPNPEVGYKALRATAAESMGLEQRSWYKPSPETKLGQMDHVWDTLSGKLNAPGSLRAAQIGAGIRAIESSAKLGAAFLSSLSDWSFQGITARANGLKFTRLASQYFELMQPGSEEARIFATRLGLVADAWTGRAVGTNRFSEQILDGSLASKLSETTFRVSLLSHSTDAGRAAFGMEFMGSLGDNVGKSLDQLSDSLPPLAKVLKRYGMTSRMWDDLRSVELAGRKGVGYVSTENIMRSSLPSAKKDKLVSTLLAMVDSEADFAVPIPDARVHGHLQQGTHRGTFMGEMMRFGTLWRSFAVTVLYTHVARGLYQGDPSKAGQYLASMFIASTMMGAVAYNAKQVVKGDEPMSFKDPRLWIAGAFQGGGMGIVGDFFQGSLSTRYGNSPLATLVGPAGSLFEDLHSVTLGNIGAAVEGKDPRLPKDAIDMAKRHLPFTSIWYTRAALQRLVFDQLQQMADPAGAQRSFRAQEQWRKREHGVSQWWKPGQTRPEFLR